MDASKNATDVALALSETNAAAAAAQFKALSDRNDSLQHRLLNAESAFIAAQREYKQALGDADELLAIKKELLASSRADAMEALHISVCRSNNKVDGGPMA